MTEATSENTHDVPDNEIEIDLKDDNIQNESKNLSSNISVEEPPMKRVGVLTDAEREIIVNNAKNGVEMKNYKVNFYKNGCHRIVLKKGNSTVSSKVINSNTAVPTPQQATYTDNQLLMEHIIELNSKYERLHLKQKKLKRKYRSIRDDLYVVDNETVENKSPDPPVYEKPIEQTVYEQPRNSQVITTNNQFARTNWRNRLQYA